MPTSPCNADIESGEEWEQWDRDTHNNGQPDFSPKTYKTAVVEQHRKETDLAQK